MLAAEALGALDGAEARELEAHLATCEECRAELEAWQATAAELAYTAPLVEPPASLRARILKSVREDSAPELSSADAETTRAKRAGVSVEESGAASNVVRFEKRPRRSWSTASKFAALAASLAFVALILSLILLWNRYNAMRQDMARLSDRFDQARAELEQERAVAAREREARELISAPDARIMSLAGTEMAAHARAKFVFDRRTGRAMLMADNLPAAPAGKAYQLWFIMEGKPPMPGQVFTPDTSGHAEMHDEVPVEARSATLFAITLEPQGGVKEPTGPKYLLSAS